MPTNTADTAERIGDRFAAILTEWLGARTMATVRARNSEWQAADPTTSACAAHDFCDANMAMAEAFEAVVGREPDVDAEGDTQLWNAAYDHAMRKHLTNS